MMGVKVLFHRICKILLMLIVCANVRADDLTVSAAASLKEAFGAIVAQYQRQYPDAQIKLNTAASGVLAQQVIRGAPVDVLATADEQTMQLAIEKRVVQAASRQIFAHNELVLVVPKNSRIVINNLRDLQQNEVQRIAIGSPNSVPAGAYAQAVLVKYNLFAPLQRKWVYTQNVRQALDYVVRGEVDAGFVYRSDAQLRQNQLKVVAQVPTVTPVSYPVAMVANSRHQAEAQRFIRYLQSAPAQAILRQYGFSQP